MGMGQPLAAAAFWLNQPQGFHLRMIPIAELKEITWTIIGELYQ